MLAILKRSTLDAPYNFADMSGTRDLGDVQPAQ